MSALSFARKTQSPLHQNLLLFWPSTVVDGHCLDMFKFNIFKTSLEVEATLFSVFLTLVGASKFLGVRSIFA